MAKDTVKSLFSISSGLLKNRERGWITAVAEELQAEGVPHSSLFTVNRDGQLQQQDLTWRAAALCRPSAPIDELLVIGVHGEVCCIRQGRITEERLELASGREPGPLRTARSIDGVAYLAGMGREVYRRNPAGTWQMIGPGDDGVEDDTICGFEGIDGFSRKDVYAAGWMGEIWKFDDKTWVQVQSPTNVSFSSLICGGDGFVYICGPKGFLLRGRDSTWEIIDHDSTIEDLWGLCWFKDNLYISTLHCVYRLVGNKLKRMSMGSGTPPTCYHLTAADGIMWSIGAKDVREFDGKRWTKVAI